MYVLSRKQTSFGVRIRLTHSDTLFFQILESRAGKNGKAGIHCEQRRAESEEKCPTTII